MSIFGEPIYAYTRAQAIEDGILVDVTEKAKEAGFRYNTCVTAAVWGDLSNDLGSGESDIGRLWDVLSIAKLAARKVKGRDRVTFQVKIGRKLNDYWMHVGPGDTRDPVLTIMQVGED